MVMIFPNSVKYFVFVIISMHERADYDYLDKELSQIGRYCLRIGPLKSQFVDCVIFEFVVETYFKTFAYS